MATRAALALGFALALAGHASAAEVTVQNDSVSNFGAAVIVWGFVAGERAASWLTSPCDGSLVAAQVLWQSPSGTQALVIGSAIYVYRSGTFPNPGAIAAEIDGPVLTDGALNEWRYLDENNSVPLNVPVTSGETVVVAFEFSEEPTPNLSPSVVRDTDGITPSGNAIYAYLGGSTYAWFNASALGVSGDWVIRAVVNCGAVATNADVSAAMSATPTAYTPGSPLQYTITIDNAGPATATNVTLVDVFPTAFQSPAWTCTGSGGASCPAPGGSGNITGTAALPAAGQLTFVAEGTVAPGTTGTLSNSMTAVVVAPTDPNTSNNIATLNLQPASAPIEADVSVTVDATPDAYTAGAPLQYTIVVANAGPDAASVDVADTFPSAYASPTWSCATTGGAACPSPSGSGNIAGTATLPAGGQIVFTVDGTVTAGTDGPLDNTASASVQAPANDPDTSDNADTLTLQPASVPVADVSVSLDATPGEYIAGTPLHYTVVVANAGPDAANVDVADTFPAAYLSPTWTCSAAGGATCPAPSGSGDIAGAAALPAGSQISFAVDGTVAAGTTGTLDNTASASVLAPASDPDTADNTVTLSIEAFDDLIFANGFESPPTALRIIAAKVAGARRTQRP